MKRQNYNIIVILALIIIFSYVVWKLYNNNIEKYANCPSQNQDINDMPESASEACNKISSKAEEIEAHYGGASNLVKNIPILNLFNPSAYKSGDNTTSDIARNIINTNLSKCEIEDISNNCRNAVSSYQSNIIDTTQCLYCQNNSCPIIGNVQDNVSKIEQVCSIQSAIKALSEKNNSIDAQALSKVLQRTEGVVSGTNKSQVENCNIISQDLSSKDYLNLRNECLNTLSYTQANELKGCGPVLNNIQKNNSIKLQQCLIGTELEKQEITDLTTQILDDVETDQSTMGIDNMTLLASSISTIILSSIFIVIASYIYKEKNQYK